MKQIEHNPDVLNCIANLSNDEVFTPPALVNQMLDMLPQELFSDPNSTFLDPFTKTAVFLREIVKRLDKGLEAIIPDRKERIDHILHKQVFGMAITELTSLLSRRTLYCSKFANGEHSISHFDTPEGNIWYQPMKHTWVNGKCKFCGAPQSVYDRGDNAEQYAYPFIHLTDLKSIYNMKFSVICGNPPYQLNQASDNCTTNSAFASAIYPLFVDAAIKLNPDYISMIVPSRWMTRTGQGIKDEWIDKMLSCNHFIEIHDFTNSSDCFTGVEIKGGVNYFLYSDKYEGMCLHILHRDNEQIENNEYLDSLNAGIVIRDSKARKILDKIILVEGDYYRNKSFSDIVGPQHFFDKDGLLTTSWRGYSNTKTDEYPIKYYLNKTLEKSGIAWIREKDIPKNKQVVPLHKVYLPKVGGSGADAYVLGKPFYGEPQSVCSQTYLVLGYDAIKHNFSKQECENIISYIRTRFFRFMVSIKKKTQDNPSGVFQFVPLQDWSKPWTDTELYKKYNLSEEEINYIESMISPME